MDRKEFQARIMHLYGVFYVQTYAAGNSALMKASGNGEFSSIAAGLGHEEIIGTVLPADIRGAIATAVRNISETNVNDVVLVAVMSVPFNKDDNIRHHRQKAAIATAKAIIKETIRSDQKISLAIREAKIDETKFSQSNTIIASLLTLTIRNEKILKSLPMARAQFLYLIWELIVHLGNFRMLWKLIERFEIGYLFVTHLREGDLSMLPFAEASPSLVRLCLEYCDPPPRDIFFQRLLSSD